MRNSEGMDCPKHLRKSGFESADKFRLTKPLEVFRL